MERVRRRLVIRGRVQGVNYRWSCRDAAERLDLDGWVRNRADGAVEVVAEGPEAALVELVAWCHQGPPHARVDAVEEHLETPQGETGFRIRR